MELTLCISAFFIMMTTVAAQDCGAYSQMEDKYIAVMSTKASWSDAESVCNLEGGHLVSIHSPTQQQTVRAAIDSRPDCGRTAWIGLSYNQGWVWSDDSGLEYGGWSGPAAVADCVSFPQLGWTAQTCDPQLCFVCQKESCLSLDDVTTMKPMPNCDTSARDDGRRTQSTVEVSKAVSRPTDGCKNVPNRGGSGQRSQSTSATL